VQHRWVGELAAVALLHAGVQLKDLVAAGGAAKEPARDLREVLRLALERRGDDVVLHVARAGHRLRRRSAARGGDHRRDGEDCQEHRRDAGQRLPPRSPDGRREQTSFIS